MRQAILLLPLMLCGCNAEPPAPTAEAWAPNAGSVHRTGQNEYEYLGDTSNGRGADFAQSYCKTAVKNGFANILLDYDGKKTEFQCFPEGAHLVPAYPSAPIINNTITR